MRALAFFIFALAAGGVCAAADSDARTVKVTDCGARGDDEADDTAGFQKALDTAARPLEVVVPRGTYYLDGTAKVGSDTTIRCEPGARIVLSAARPHRRGEFLLTNRNKEAGDRNIRLVGGVWDGDSQKPNNKRKRWDGRRESMTPDLWSGALLDFRNVKGLVFRDLDLRNSHAFYVRLCLIDGFDFRRTRFSSEKRTGNQDGFHLNGFCRNGLIEDTEAVSGQTDDDLFAFNADDILWREINYDMVCGPIENVTVRNARAPDCHGAVRLLSVDSPIRNVRFENIEAGNRCYFVNADAARYCCTPMFRDEERPDGVGHLENIVFRNCRYWASEPLLGADEPLLCWETNMKGVVLENVTRDRTRDRAPQRPDARVRKCTGAPVVRDDDYVRPVRPIGVNGQVAWNEAASQFMYAPTFGFKPVAGAENYRFELTDAKGARHDFTATQPNAALSPIWSDVPTGRCALKVVALAENGTELGVAGERKFMRMAPFDAAKYPKATMPYDEAAKKILGYVFRRPYLKYLLENGRPDESYPLNSYPSKMLGSQIFGLLHYARQNPSDRATALRMARLNADWLMKRAEPAGSPLAYFTRTYDGRGEAGNSYLGEKFDGQHMLHYPAAAASALLAVWRETGETKYRDFAVRIADTYLKLQGEDGTWWQKMDGKTGKPVCDNRLVPTRVMPFLEEIAAVTGEEKYRAAAERAFGYIENGPMKDWCWDGQFEDIYPAPRYRNLSKYGPCDTAIYLLKRFPGDKRRLAQAREMLRFSEDQFVVWEAPHQPSWHAPVVLEQYHCYAPIDESVAKLISTYLALYRAEGNPTDLAKAKALGDSMTQVLLADGRLRTYWNTTRTDNEHEDWVNGQVADAFALEELAATSRRRRSGR